MKVAVVGAAGALGQMVDEALRLAGHSVVRVNRSAGPRTDVVADVLEADLPSMKTRVDAVVYLAWATGDRRAASQAMHVAAAGRWASAALVAQARFIFASSTLASRGVTSEYGCGKRAAEDVVVGHGGVVARIGLVVDDAYPSLVATAVRRVVRRVPVVGRMLDWPVFPVGGPHMAQHVVSLIASGTPGSRVWVAEASPVSLAEIAASPDSAPRGSGIAKGFGQFLADARIPPVLRPALLDGWRGLVTGPPQIDGRCVAPPAGYPQTGSWQDALCPPLPGSKTGA